MDALLANQSGAIPIASATPRALNRGSLASPVKRLFTACAAGEGFLLYAILVAHTLRPVTAILIGHDSGRPGASARYQQVFNWDGLIPTMLGSLFVVAAVWCALQLTARNLPMPPLEQLQMAPAEDPTASGVINLSARAD